MKFTIVYASPYGQTRIIAEYIRKSIFLLNDDGYSADLLEISKHNSNPDLPMSAEAVIIGTPIYAGKFPKHLIKWVQNHKEELRGKPLAFFTVSLNAADKRLKARATDTDFLRKMINAFGLVPGHIASLAGALKYRDYGWLKRFIMKRISASAGGPTDTSQNYEMTDWSRVSAFIDAFKNQNRKSEFATAVRFPNSQEFYMMLPEFDHIWSPVPIGSNTREDVFASPTLKLLRTDDLIRK
jgi:menaquinone-dependent protoporphyrinogen oxidase